MATRLLVTTAVCNYRPEICALTFPNLQAYASRCHADFHVIRDRKYPDWHPAYEKLQVYDLASQYDYTILIDADIAIHPRLPDLFEVLKPNTCGSWLEYKISGGPESLTLWDVAGDRYFLRDGRNLGICGTMVGCSKWTYDIFKPLDFQYKPEDIQPKLYRPAIVDEYVMSRNAAKFGLKVDCLWPTWNGIFHADATTKGEAEDVIIARLKAQLMEWK